jgi:hypothetical protein
VFFRILANKTGVSGRRPGAEDKDPTFLWAKIIGKRPRSLVIFGKLGKAVCKIRGFGVKDPVCMRG